MPKKANEKENDYRFPLQRLFPFAKGITPQLVIIHLSQLGKKSPGDVYFLKLFLLRDRTLEKTVRSPSMI